MDKTKVSIRISEFESIKRKEFLFKKIKWVWLDNFTKLDLDKKFFVFLKRKKIKFCVVSPELIKMRRIKEIKTTFKKLKRMDINPDAICTKKPKLWRKLIYGK